MDSVISARQDVTRAYTQMQLECVSTNLFRLEAHRLSVLGELLAHSRAHGCAQDDIRALLAGIPAAANQRIQGN